MISMNSENKIRSMASGANIWNLTAADKQHNAWIGIDLFAYHMWVFARNDVCMNAFAAVRCCHFAAKFLQLAVCCLAVRLYALFRVDGSHGAGLNRTMSTATKMFSCPVVNSLQSGIHGRERHASPVGIDTSRSNGLVVRGQ